MLTSSSGIVHDQHSLLEGIRFCTIPLHDLIGNVIQGASNIQFGRIILIFNSYKMEAGSWKRSPIAKRQSNIGRKNYQIL
uniref:Uncharacterized protein n=1 Tax=Lutzomyia longipalpis TaxID=7200 RepID=A0A1B0CBT2_LUTLO